MSLETLKQEIDKKAESGNSTFLNYRGRLQDLSATEVNQLMEYVAAKLPDLKELRLDDNNLTVLPPAVIKLTALKQLGLGNNQLRDLPAALNTLQNLWILDLSNNSFNAVPRVVQELRNLNSLSFASNYLSTVPEALAGLELLTSLDVSNNPALLQLPAVIYEKQLQEEHKLGITYNNASEALRTSFVGYENQKSFNQVMKSFEAEKFFSPDDLILVGQALEKLNETGTVFKTDNGKAYSATKVLFDFMRNVPEDQGGYQKYYDAALRSILDVEKLKDLEESKELLGSLAITLGDCATPVHDFMTENIINLNRDNPEIRPLMLRMAVKERISDAFYGELVAIENDEIIEKINTLVDSVLQQGAEEEPGNKLKITGDRMYSPSYSLNPGFLRFENDRYNTLLKKVAKLFCLTNKKGKLIKNNDTYTIDNTKLSRTLNLYLVKKNRISEIDTSDLPFVEKIEAIKAYENSMGMDINKIVTKVFPKGKEDLYEACSDAIGFCMTDATNDLQAALIEEKNLKTGYKKFLRKVENDLKSIRKKGQLAQGKTKSILNMFAIVPLRRTKKVKPVKKERTQSTSQSSKFRMG